MQYAVAVDHKNQNKGVRISVIVHLLILLIAFFYYLPEVDLAELEDKPPYAVKVDFTFQESSLSKFAHDDEGAQRAKSESAPAQEKVEEPQPEPAAEEVKPVEEEVVKPEEIEVTKPQVITVNRPQIKLPAPVYKPSDDVVIAKTPSEEAPVKVSEPTKSSVPSPQKSGSSSGAPSSTSGSTTGTSTAPASTVNGSTAGTGKGNTGTGAGKDSGKDGDAGLSNSSDGTGEYDGSGDGVFGRKIIFRDLSATKAAINVSGRVVTKICINRAGIVTYTELMPGETTVRDNKTLKLYLKAARGYKFQPDLKAPKEQCGKLSFKVDNTINNKVR
jgi:outer membrane biosynthesis protein TonB